MTVFLNGTFVPEDQALVPVTDRGFLFGDGLFETMRVYHGRPFRWQQHLERLGRGAQFLKITLPHTPQELYKFARELVKQNDLPEAVLRVTVSRGGGPRGYSPRGADRPTVVMTLEPAPEFDPANPPRYRLITSSYRLPVADALASYKTCNKLIQILARAEAEEKDADEALLLNTNGEVSETAGANLFWVYHDTIYATPSGRGALPGITRAVVLELCQTLGLPTGKRVIKPESLLRSEAVFVTQSILGIVPVVNIDDQPIGDSPLVDQLQQAYAEMAAKV